MGGSYPFKVDGNIKPLNENYGSEFDFNAGKKTCSFAALTRDNQSLNALK
jgi:hypothetical protein